MARLYLEMSLDSANDYICEFFKADIESISAFYAVCDHFLEIDPEIVIRREGEIIGASKHGEYYRFYISNEAGVFYIKYKHIGKKEEFVPSQVEKYKAYNVDSNQFFIENRGNLLRKMRETRSAREQFIKDNDGYVYPMFLSPEDLEKWKQIRQKGKSLRLSDEEFNKIYDRLVSVIYDLCDSEVFLSEMDYDIVKTRILPSTDEVVVLQALADKYEITRERVRQRELSSWKRIKRFFNGRKSKIHSTYRERLADLLLDIPTESLVLTVERISKRSKYLGAWIKELYGLS